MSGELMVDVRDVRKSFGSVEVLSGITLDVHHGDVVAIIGPSGSGKSTLLRCINQLERVDSGDVIVNGVPLGYRLRGNRFYELNDREICAQRRDIGMVFQHFNLFAHLSVLDNLTLGPRLVGKTPRPKAEEFAREMLARVGLAGREYDYPSQFSGGQQQRIAIARALCMRPQLMLFDEPTSALDPELVGEVLAVIRELAAQGMTMVIVTHEIAFARDVADRLVVMDDGVIIESGSPDQVLTSPTQDRTRRFLASVR
jgi:polar amino acid transport system ATP-binding protein